MKHNLYPPNLSLPVMEGGKTYLDRLFKDLRFAGQSNKTGKFLFHMVLDFRSEFKVFGKDPSLHNYILKEFLIL